MASDRPRRPAKNRRPDALADVRLAAVLESISDIYYAVDRDWRLVLFNRAAEQFFGMPREQILGRSFWELFPRRESEFGQLLVRAMDEGQAGRLTAPSALRAGRTVEVHVAPLAEIGVGVSIDDITERHEAERAVRRSEQRLDLAVGAHKIGIFDWHVPSGRATWNGEMEDIFGIPRGTFEGHTNDFRRRVVPEDLARIEAETDASVAAGHDLVNYQFRIQRADGEIRWIEGAARTIFDAEGKPWRMVGTNIDITDRKLGEQHQRLLLNELNHRVKNTLAIVQAIAWQSFRSAGVAREARDAFEGRLAALAAAHDVLTLQNWEAAAVGRILEVATAPHSVDRFTLSGPAVDLQPKTAVALGLAAHELATNAVKYGALSTPEGRVEVRWTVEDGVLRLTWREHGGPPTAAPAQRGFGSRLLEQGLAEELAGSVTLDFRPEGLVCSVEARLS